MRILTSPVKFWTVSKKKWIIYGNFFTGEVDKPVNVNIWTDNVNTNINV